MSVGAGQVVKTSMKAINKVDDAVDAVKTVDNVKDTQNIKPIPKRIVTQGKSPREEQVVQNHHKSIEARDKNHHKNVDGFGPAKLDKSSTNKDAMRGREQQLIDSFGGAQSQGGNSGYKINGVSPKNKNAERYRQEAIKQGF